MEKIKTYMQVKVLFFGVLSEVAGSDCRYYKDVSSTDDLRHRILDEFPEIEHYNYTISLNNEIIESDMPMGDSDEVAFLPPFAGG
jgi:molybdopterin converting factor small subunit